MPAGFSDRTNGATFVFSISVSNIKEGVHYAFDLPTPFASAGALAKHTEHSLDEHGMSRLRYNSLTIFCTFPLLVDLTNTLLEMLEAYGSASDRLRLVIAASRLFDIKMSARNFSPNSSKKFLVPSLKSQSRQIFV